MKEISCGKETGCSVLIIEDNSVDAQILRLVLEQRSIEVTYCSNGDQAWNLIHHVPVPDLVFLDLMLPGVNGFTLLEHIRSKSLWEKVPVVVVSGIGDIANVKEALRLGAAGYIHKPYDLRRLRDEINKYLARLITSLPAELKHGGYAKKPGHET